MPGAICGEEGRGVSTERIPSLSELFRLIVAEVLATAPVPVGDSACVGLQPQATPAGAVRPPQEEMHQRGVLRLARRWLCRRLLPPLCALS